MSEAFLLASFITFSLNGCAPRTASPTKTLHKISERFSASIESRLGVEQMSRERLLGFGALAQPFLRSVLAAWCGGKAPC